MPAVFYYFGFEFKFYSNEHEPLHIHVVKGRARAKFQQFPVTFIQNNGLKPSDLKHIEAVIRENQEKNAEEWNRHFNKIK